MTKPYAVYLGNAMSNIPEFNFPWFFDAEEYLLTCTHVTKVMNPARKDLEKIPLEEMKTIPGYDTGDLALYVANSSFTMGNAMEWDLPAIKSSKGIVLGDGWPTSTGARWERCCAEALGREVWLLHGDKEQGFELELDPEQQRLTAFLKTYGQPNTGEVVEVLHIGDSVHEATSLELLDEIGRRFPNHPGIKSGVEHMKSHFA